MEKVNFVPTPSRPFVLFSMGLDGYTGERRLWNLSTKQDTTVYHILVRIKNEMEMAQRTGHAHYLFGTHKPFDKPRKKLIEEFHKKPIDILFTVNLKDLAKMEGMEEPCCADLRTSTIGWRRMVNMDDQQSTPIPDKIRLWPKDSDLPYYGLWITDFRYFSPDDEQYLRGKHLFHYLHDTPVKSWAQFRMGTLYVDTTKRSKSIRCRRIRATAKLAFPYIYEIKKK